MPSASRRGYEAVPDPAVAYARLSEDREGQEAGVGAQLDVCRRYAQEQGLSLVAELFDNDVSASRYSKAERPAYSEVLDLCRTGAVRHVVVRETSRLYRRPRDLEDLIDLCEHQGVSVHAPLGGRVDLSTGSGRFYARVLAAVDAQESDRISERVRYRHDAIAKAGGWGGGGSRPYGYRYADLSVPGSGLVVDPAEALVVQELARRLLAGETLWALADDLNARGLPTSTGRQWQVTPLRRMLSRPHLAGLREHTVAAPGGRRTVVGVYPAQWPAVLSLDVWEGVQAALRAGHQEHAPRSRAYLLSGLAWCERCGRRMDGHALGHPGKPPVRRYECHAYPGRNGCGQTVVAEGLEAEVMRRVFTAIDEGERLRARKSRQATGGSGGVAAVSDKLAAVEARRRDLSRAYAAGELSLALTVDAERMLGTEAQRLTEELRAASADPQPVAAGSLPDLAALWESANFGQRRALAERAVERAWVRPAVKAGRGSRAVDRLARLDLKAPLVEPVVEP